MTFLCLLFIPLAITWENTGELQSALYVYDITIGSGGYIYAGTKIDTTSQDCGRVFVSQDMWNWQRCAGVPWVQPDTIEGVYALHNGVGDTLFAGTGLYHSEDVPRIHKSSDGGATWTALNSYGNFRVGSRIYALFEDNLGYLHLGNNYWGGSAALPRRSTGRGSTWEIPTGVVYNSQQYCFCQSSDNAIYFGSWGGDGVHCSTDNGATWSRKFIVAEISDSYTTIEGGSDTIFVGTDADIGRIYMTTDQGDSWVEKGDGQFNGATAIRSLLYASDGAIYAGTSPNAEVFVSVDKGDTWISTGILSGATTVYKLIETTKTGSDTDMDSVFLFAATGPNGDVFRGLLYTINVDEQTNTEQQIAKIQVVPNPFKNNVKITFQINTPGIQSKDLSLKIFDASGRLIKQFNHLISDRSPAFRITWDGKDDTDKQVPAGVYFVRLETPYNVMSRTLVVIE